MFEVNFIYNGNQTKIFCNENDSLKEIFKKFKSDLNIQNKKIIYEFNGNKISDENKTIEQIADNKFITISVYNDDNMPSNGNIISQSTEVICPECKSSAFLTIKDYKFNLSCCKNSHIFKNILNNAILFKFKN